MLTCPLRPAPSLRPAAGPVLPRVLITCQVCGAEVERLEFARYCGEACRARAKRRRQRGAA